MKAVIQKFTEKGIVLSTSTTETRKIGNKDVTIRRRGQLGFLMATGFKEAGLKVGDDFPFEIKLSDDKIVSTNGEEIPVHWAEVV